MERGKPDARGPREATGTRGAPADVGRRASTGKPGATRPEAERLNRLVADFDDLYQQLTARAKRIAATRRRLDAIGASLTRRR